MESEYLLSGGGSEDLYRQLPDPWSQSTRTLAGSDSFINVAIADFIRRKKPGRVFDIGCGLGIRSSLFHETQVSAGGGDSYLGIDSSRTAIERAQLSCPEIEFAVMEFSEMPRLLEQSKFDLIIMSEITWYVLDSLEDFAKALYEFQQGSFFCHSLVVYPKGVQKKGTDFFTTSHEIRRWWVGIDWQEWLEAGDQSHATTNTLNLGIVKEFQKPDVNLQKHLSEDEGKR